MTPRASSKSIIDASRILGAFFCLLVTTCSEKKTATETWQNAASEQGQAQAAENPPAKPPASAKSKSSSQPDNPGNNKETRFLAYNLRNYLTMRRYLNGEAVSTSKPEDEVQALIDIIRSAKPDILGVCEIGNPSDLKDLQTRLHSAGVNLPHTHRVHGPDQTRALAILSRYPIIETATAKNLNYTIDGTPFAISRGILDATIQLPNRKVRFLGVHFKSKRPIREADQNLMRRNESLLLRKHIDDILTTSSDTQILAYGDFNDTKRTETVSTVRGRSNSPLHMNIIELTDSRGEYWTHHWKREDIYSRIDFVMASSNLTSHINKKSCKLLDPPNWELASDHRPMLILIK